MIEVTVNDSFQRGYSYLREAPAGGDFDPAFSPRFSPAEMLALGVFEGKYINDCTDEFGPGWFAGARLSERPDPACNFFGVKSRLPLAEWRKRGWIYGPDPRGWFQWYCRYWSGRRLPETDRIQIRRWRAFARHAGQIRANCMTGDLSCRPRQRQALLQWAHDAFL